MGKGINAQQQRQPNRKERRAMERANKRGQGETKIVRIEDYDHHPVRKTKEFVLRPRNDLQKKYMNLVKSMNMVIGIGSSGTGKTFIPSVLAAQALASGNIDTIYIVRPNVELGREIGFVKGTMLEKMRPWIAPVLDGFEEVFDMYYLNLLLEKEVIRVVPESYLRGRTFKNCWVIYDEAQNSEREIMHCFVERIGENCKVMICGDIQQKDIVERSGLADLLLIADAYETIPFGLIELEENVRGELAGFFNFAYKDLNLVEHMTAKTVVDQNPEFEPLTIEDTLDEYSAISV